MTTTPIRDSAVSSPFVQSPKLCATNGTSSTAKANGTANGQRKDFLSERAATTEIDGSEFIVREVER